MVRRAIDSVNRGDFRLAMEDTADDFEMDWSNSIGPLRGVYRGREEVTRFWESFHDAWDNLRWDIQEALDLGGGRVRLLGHGGRRVDRGESGEGGRHHRLV